jgi:hypothetical protein
MGDILIKDSETETDPTRGKKLKEVFWNEPERACGNSESNGRQQ